VIYDDAIEATLHARLRRPESPSTVPGALPVLFFGDLLMANVATVSLNPSNREYVNRAGHELIGLDRRFETLGSLGAPSRASMTGERCNRAVSTMRGYFDPGRPVYNWFNGMGRVMEGFGFPYWKRQAAHLDLVQEATAPTWSRLRDARPGEVQALMEQDIPFLKWQIDTFPLAALVCNGRSTFDQVVRLARAETVASGELARVTWTIALAHAGDRQIAVVGWNIPLSRPTGLTADGQVEMGQAFRERLDGLGVALR
jgi:hypothetical protein